MMEDAAQVDEAVAIRPMEMRDAEAVCELVAQLGYERTPRDIERWIAENSSDGGRQAAFVACMDGEVAGWIEVSIEHRLQSAPFALIGGLVVREGLRNHGIGRQLCAMAETWTRARGIERLRVTSRSTRADAHRFYLRDGYETVKTSMVFEKSVRAK